MTLYNIKALPQRLQVNPALTPDSRVFVGLPGLSSLDMNFQISAFNLSAFSDAIYDVPNSDSTGLNISLLSDAFNKDNVISFKTDVDLINFGFKVKKNYFSVLSSFNTDFRLSYPGDAFSLIFEGNGTQSTGETNVGRTFDFPLSADVLVTADIGLGYAREVTDKLTVGGAVRRIYGIATFNTVKNDITFTTRPSDFAYIATSDIEVNSASIFGNLLDSTTSTDDPAQSFQDNKNTGWGFDLGARYKINDKIEVHASIVDLGFINWETNTTKYASRNPGAEYVFDGFELDEIFGDSADIDESFQRLGDSLRETFQLDSSGGSFRQNLFTEFYVGGNFNLTANHNAGLLFYGSFYNKKFLPGVTISWNSKLTRIFSVSASASYISGTVRNIGLGNGVESGASSNVFCNRQYIRTAKCTRD